MKKFNDEQFDNQFLKLKPNLYWLPWVGKDYINVPSGKKLLIVGESHYVPKGEEPNDGYNDANWSRMFIQKEGLKQPPLYEGNAINPLIRNTEKAIFNNQNPSDENKEKLWTSTSYFNLIQRLLESRDGEDRPEEDDLIKALPVFLNVLDILNPDTCLMLGKLSFGYFGHYFQNNKTEWTLDVVENKENKILRLTKNDKVIKLVFINHPSSYFSWENWAPFLNEQLHEFKTVIL